MPQASQFQFVVARYFKEYSTKVKQCQTCVEHRPNRLEPLLPSKFPNKLWEVITDYYFRYLELYKVGNITAKVIIQCMIHCFARHGIPLVVRSDNGPQFNLLKTANSSSLRINSTLITLPYCPNTRRRIYRINGKNSEAGSHKDKRYGSAFNAISVDAIRMRIHP